MGHISLTTEEGIFEKREGNRIYVYISSTVQSYMPFKVQ